MPCSASVIVDSALCRGDVARRGRLHDLARRLGHGVLRPRIGELGLGARQGNLVVTLIDDNQLGAFGNLLVVRHQHCQHGAADTRSDRHHMRIDLRIVGALTPARQPEIGAAAKNGDECDETDDPDAYAHFSEPLIAFINAASAPPVDSARIALATL
jgi:hypothetical protein